MSKRFSFVLMVMLLMVWPMIMTMARDKDKKPGKKAIILQDDPGSGIGQETYTTYYDESNSISMIPVGTLQKKCDGSIIMIGRVTPYYYTIIVQECPKP